MKWEDFKLAPTLCAELVRCGFKEPTKVQAECLKELDRHKDMLVSARTGEGKTLTFTIPILNAFVNGEKATPLALILSPTRELAIQIESHIKAVGKPLGIKTCSLVGGLAAVKQRRILTKGHPHIIVATPGRLWDLMSQGQIDYLKDLNKVKFVVIDEGDRMVESGHFRELQNILDFVYYADKGKKVQKKEEIPALAEGAKEFVEEKFDLEKVTQGLSSDKAVLLQKSVDINDEIDIGEIEREDEDEEQAEGEEAKGNEGNAVVEKMLAESEEGEENKDQDQEESEDEEKSAGEEEKKEEEGSEKKEAAEGEEKKKKRKHAKKRQKNVYQKQTIVCSATLILDAKGRFQHRLPKKQIKGANKDRVSELFKRIGFRGKPLIINMTEGQRLPDELHEFYAHCDKDDKDLYLAYYLRETGKESVIIFCNSITCCKRLQSLLKTMKYAAYCLHSKMEQGQRLKSLDKFRDLHNLKEKKSKAIMICTDVGARGIDIPDIPHIIHYQLPAYAEIYIHRCGRTARIFKKGNTLALVGPEDEKNYKAIVGIVRKKVTGTEGGESKAEGTDGHSEIAGAKRYEVNYAKLTALRSVVEKATELETKVHQERKKKADSKWMQQAANEADIELDPNLLPDMKDDDDGEPAPMKKKRTEQQIKWMQKEYEQDYQEVDTRNFSGSSFLTPEMVAKYNQLAGSAPVVRHKSVQRPQQQHANHGKLWEKAANKKGNKYRRRK